MRFQQNTKSSLRPVFATRGSNIRKVYTAAVVRTIVAHIRKRMRRHSRRVLPLEGCIAGIHLAVYPAEGITRMGTGV